MRASTISSPHSSTTCSKSQLFAFASAAEGLHRALFIGLAIVARPLIQRPADSHQGSRTTSNEDHVARSGSLGGLHSHDIDIKTGLPQSTLKSRVLAGRPHRQDAAGTKSIVAGTESSCAIKLLVVHIGQSHRTVVDIKKDRIKSSPGSLDGIEYIFDHQPTARIPQRMVS